MAGLLALNPKIGLVVPAVLALGGTMLDLIFLAVMTKPNAIVIQNGRLDTILSL